MSVLFSGINAENIARCEQLIRPYIRRTPVIAIDAADVGVTADKLYFKLELLQHSGSFKARGAFANLLTRDLPAAGVAAASGGNHGAAVAFAAMRLDVPAKIFVPTVSSPSKIERIRSYGADLLVEGDLYADALAASEKWILQSGAMPVHAFDQDETILGQGSIAMELQEQPADIDTLLVSVGGGGLIAGVAAWYANRTKIVGVEPAASPTLTKALTVGRPTDAEAGGVAADSLAPRRVGDRVFPIVQAHVHSAVLVPDEAIVAAQKTLWQKLRIVAEPGGSTAFAALLSGAYLPSRDERIGVILSGGNTTAVSFS